MQDRYRSVYILVVSIYLCEECDEATKAKACSAQCSGLLSWSGLLLGRRSETDGSRSALIAVAIDGSDRSSRSWPGSYRRPLGHQKHHPSRTRTMRGARAWPPVGDVRSSSLTETEMEDGREKEEDFGGFLHQKARLWARCLANFNSPAAESLPWHAPPTPTPSSNQQGGLCFARIESASSLTVPVLSYSYSTYPVRPSLVCYSDRL